MTHFDNRTKILITLTGLLFITAIIFAILFLPNPEKSKKITLAPKPHFDHSHLFTKKFTSGSDVTKRCLECHEEAGKDMLHSSHYTWISSSIKKEGMDQAIPIGKKNLINNFCISITGNWEACTKCHAGYNWKDDTYKFDKVENVDCLVCHDWSGAYRKSKAGLPAKGVNLLAAAKSVGYPKRDNCGTCHYYGGGGLGVKHGDLDNTLVNPASDDDIHMGGKELLCIDCHQTKNHKISGKAYSVSVNHEGGISCTDCHVEIKHRDSRIQGHLDHVACQTCHIPDYARKVPTKMNWDWSTAGDDSRKENVHHYQKIKGDFVYDRGVIPEYYWFNLTADRYLVGDKIDGDLVKMNHPNGDIKDPKAKIWPFKVHRGKQPYDKNNHYIIPPVTAGKDGYWKKFNWDLALSNGAKLSGLEYSGEYDFIDTSMYWPLSHMVAGKEKVLSCNDCHGEKGRMDWKALGYIRDPLEAGGRNSGNKLKGKQ